MAEPLYPLWPIVQVAELCARLGVAEAVLSPGSRSAPLTIAFARHPHIGTRIVSDERSAAFIALGMAQQSGKPVALVCTSGSAAYNYAPAVAEAFFLQVPLLVFTADRPPEWVDQADGQTIRQRDIYGRHCKAAYELPADYAHPDALWHIGRTVAEAIHTSRAYPPGPVHINAPFREPFYPKAGQNMAGGTPHKVMEEMIGEPTLRPQQWDWVYNVLLNSPKILLLAGQDRHQAALQNALETLQFPTISEVISNMGGLSCALRYHDSYLGLPAYEASPAPPDLLISFGKSVLSKSLKNFIRRHKPRQHWHLQPAGPVPDTFQSLTQVLRVSPAYFFGQLAASNVAQTLSKQVAPYLAQWQAAEGQVAQWRQQFVNAWQAGQWPFSEMEAVAALLHSLPKGAALHLANSMPVRYANALQVPQRPDVEVFANRGASGIDGCLSTTVGHALANPSRLHLLITGDLAFIYDRNGLWHKYVPPNLRVAVLNNHGGGIFRLIDGPSGTPELDEYFVTQQALTAKATATESGLAYFYSNSAANLHGQLNDFWTEDSQAKLLEVETEHAPNETVWKAWRAFGK